MESMILILKVHLHIRNNFQINQKAGENQRVYTLEVLFTIMKYNFKTR